MSEQKDPIASILEQVNKEQKGKTSDVVDNKTAPAQIGKPVFEKDLEILSAFGIKGLQSVIGHRIDENAQGKTSAAMPLNFGSKASVGKLPDDVRLRLFNLKKLVSDAEIQAGYIYKTANVSPEQIMSTPIFKDMVAPMLKAYNVTDFVNWIPTVQARFYFEEFEIPYLLANQFDMLPMEATSMEVAGDLGFMEGVEETDDATFTPQYTTAAKYPITARNNVVHSKITEDLIADSAPAYIERYRRNVLIGTARAFEKSIINGDTTILTSIRGDGHQDTDTRALALNATFSKSFDGLRKRAFANTANGVVIDNQGDSVSKTTFAKLLESFDEAGTDKSDLMYIVPNIIETKVITGAIPELFTAFTYGSVASNVSGKCPPIFGISPLSSAFMRTDLNASGVYQSGQTLTSILLVKKSRFACYTRQATRVWAAPTAANTDQMSMTAKTRHTFAGNPQSAKEKSVAMAINIAR